MSLKLDLLRPEGQLRVCVAENLNHRIIWTSLCLYDRDAAKVIQSLVYVFCMQQIYQSATS